jgi:dTMP kinase
MCRYIVIEGVDGTGKSTQVEKLSTYLVENGFKVLMTKEPGTKHAPITVELRGFMLNAKYDEQLTKTSRELINQAIRSIHLEKVIAPAMKEYDFIIQDRGILSSLAYGQACENDVSWLQELSNKLSITALGKCYNDIYDDVIYLKGDIEKSLKTAKSSKQEYAEGDAIENKGASFMKEVSRNMDTHSHNFNVRSVYVDNKNIDEVFENILNVLKIS